MIYVILVVSAILGFFTFIFTRRLIVDIKAGKARQSGHFSKRSWRAIHFHIKAPGGVPMRMAFTEVATKQSYQGNFKATLSRFADVAIEADDALDINKVATYLGTVLTYASDPGIWIHELSVSDAREAHMIESAALYALICTQDKGANIKNKLMLGKTTHANNDFYLQQKTDREYFEYMNDHYPNFCQLVDMLEPHKSAMIEIAAGYLLTD